MWVGPVLAAGLVTSSMPPLRTTTAQCAEWQHLHMLSFSSRLFKSYLFLGSISFLSKNNHSFGHSVIPHLITELLLWARQLPRIWGCKEDKHLCLGEEGMDWKMKT